MAAILHDASDSSSCHGKHWRGEVTGGPVIAHSTPEGRNVERLDEIALVRVILASPLEVTEQRQPYLPARTAPVDAVGVLVR